MTHTSHRSDARENRSRLLEAARTVFYERGLGAEMKEIADRAGIGVGTVYRNFATKDDLVEAILAEFVLQFREVVGAAVQLPPEQAVRFYIEHAMHAFADSGLLSRAVLSGDIPACAGPQLNELLGDTRMRTIFERGIQDGTFRPNLDPAVAAAMIFAIVNPVATLPATEIRAVETVREELTTTFLRGILA